MFLSINTQVLSLYIERNKDIQANMNKKKFLYTEENVSFHWKNFRCKLWDVYSKLWYVHSKLCNVHSKLWNRKKL